MSLVAFPASSAANPPVVPTCTFPNTTGSDSCTSLQLNAFTPPIGGTLENVGVGFRFSSQFDPSTSEITNVELRFQKDIQFDLAGIPTCPSSELTGKDIAAAWDQCGSDAGTANNAYLSTGLGPNVSGIGSTVPVANWTVCIMIFKGADNGHLTIYARQPVGSVDGCDDPETNHLGSQTVLFTVDLTEQPEGSPRDWKIFWDLVHTWNPNLDDFYVTLRRGGAFQARCPEDGAPFDIVGLFDYLPAGDADDSDVATDPCP